MTAIEILIKRWDCIIVARHLELQDLHESTIPQARLSVIQQHNEDPFWENIFDLLEGQLRELDPNHEYLPENQIEIA